MEMAMFRVNQKMNEGIKRLTMYLQYHGISRIGLQMLCIKGVCVDPRTNDRNANRQLSMYDAKLTNIIREGKAVMGIDNYNHAYGSPVISLEHKNMLRLANFTVCGISICQRPVDNLFVLNESGDPLPSLPDQKIALAAYVRPVLNQIAQAIATMTDFCYWTESTVVREQLGSVPLRPENKRPNPHTRSKILQTLVRKWSQLFFKCWHSSCPNYVV